MKKIKFSEHVLPHLVAIILFLVVTFLFFSPVFFENKIVSQGDIHQFAGASKSLRDYRQATGKEALWAPSMFSGMPAYLVGVKWGEGPVTFFKRVLTVGLPHPITNIFAAFVCYYILLLCFRVRPYLSIAGALAFGLSSYMIIGLMAGHNARIGAIAFVPLVIGGIHLAFTGKRLLAFALTSAGLALQLRENHLQITYYLMLIVAIYGLVQLIYAVKAKQVAEFLKSIGVLVVAASIGAATFFGQFWAVTEYTRYSIRGPSELVKAGSKATVDQEGLSKDYAFQYNYGIFEPMTLIVPEFYGGSSMKAFVNDEKSASYNALVNSGNQNMAQQLSNYTVTYWGPQTSGTLGPYYGGAIIFFLFVLGVVFAERRYVWWLVPVSILSLMVSWGDSFEAFNYFMFDHFPGYNKFRSFSFALIMILFAMPLLGFIGLEKFLSEPLNKETKKKLIIAVSVAGGLCLLLVVFAGMGSYTRGMEYKLPPWFLKALQSDRQSLLRSDAFRSLSFIVAVFIVLYFNVKKLSETGLYAFLIFVVGADLATVDKRYFTKDNYQRKQDNSFVAESPADEVILRDKDYYRVYNPQWTEARTSYSHYSLGGYHGAKCAGTRTCMTRALCLKPTS
jgi:hypothetical protein